mmetsp:Transcript_27091/g.68159  ORF Transcript_27091/g.68159 Transcript_27091/m.68159 type:complete len:272 (-) Transcript_27091:90-905(-)
MGRPTSRCPACARWRGWRSCPAAMRPASGSTRWCASSTAAFSKGRCTATGTGSSCSATSAPCPSPAPGRRAAATGAARRATGHASVPEQGTRRRRRLGRPLVQPPLATVARRRRRRRHVARVSNAARKGTGRGTARASAGEALDPAPPPQRKAMRAAPPARCTRCSAASSRRGRRGTAAGGDPSATSAGSRGTMCSTAQLCPANAPPRRRQVGTTRGTGRNEKLHEPPGATVTPRLRRCRLRAAPQRHFTCFRCLLCMCTVDGQRLMRASP